MTQRVYTGHGGSRLAATVMLVRDGRLGLEVWVQERVTSMPNYPGVTVFPGGGVEVRDFPMEEGKTDASLWSGLPVEDLAAQLGTTTSQAQALAFAAVRELFEETGTLLATHSNGTVVADASPFHPERLALESHRLSLTHVLWDNNLRINCDLLHPWARWVGASESGNEFDNFTFLAAHPTGQEPDDDTSEADSGGWFPPQLLLEGWRAGLVRFVIPTWAQLLRLSRCASVEEALAEAAKSDMTPVVGDPIDDPQYREFFTVKPHVRI